jgi:hypothetical protein
MILQIRILSLYALYIVDNRIILIANSYEVTCYLS